MEWIIITGGGSGIGRGIVQHFSRNFLVLTCGRRIGALEETRAGAAEPENVKIVQADIGDPEQRAIFCDALPSNARVVLLLQNAAIGDPADFLQVTPAHLEEALRVNVVAPVALTQAFLSALKAGKGRVLHMGTSVAHRPQEGTLTYGVTKMAFHRLYQQLNAEKLGVPCGSLSPGMVDTEGVVDHIAKARACKLPHVQYFDEAREKGWYTPMPKLMMFVEYLMKLDDEQFVAKEWKFSEWAQQPSTDPNPAAFASKV